MTQPPPVTQVDLEELRALAKATRTQPGDWFGADALCEYVTQFRMHEAAFIAAANPTVVLALIAELTSLRAQSQAGGVAGGGESPRILAEVAYKAVMKDLLGRCGISDAFDDIDEDIRVEIDAACVAKAEAALRKHMAPAPPEAL